MPSITLIPSKNKVDIEGKKALLEELKKKDILLNSSCGGFGTCGDCKIKIVKGYDHCSAPTYEEIKLLGNVFHLTQERLSCQLKVTGDMEIDISEHLRKPARSHQKKDIKKTKIRKPSTLVAKEPLLNNESKDLKKSEQLTEKQGGFSRPKRKF
jgi:2Fe-2S ferredoxin